MMINYYCISSIFIVGVSIISHQSAYFSNENTPVTFRCTATGIPTPDITWYRNGSSLLSSSDPRITVGPPSQQLLSSGLYQVVQTLTITNTADSDSGSYSCVGNNTVSMDTSTFELVVRSKLADSITTKLIYISMTAFYPILRSCSCDHNFSLWSICCSA